MRCEVSHVYDVGRGGSHGVIGQIAEGGGMAGQVETIDIIALAGNLENLSRLRIELIEVDIVATLGPEIDISIDGRPYRTAIDIGVEVLGEGPDLLGGEVVEEQLILRHTGSAVGRQLTANAVEGLGIAQEEHLRAVG